MLSFERGFLHQKFACVLALRFFSLFGLLLVQLATAAASGKALHAVEGPDRRPEGGVKSL